MTGILQKIKSREVQRWKNILKKSFNSKPYHLWYWENLIRHMEKNINKSNLGLGETQPYINKPGIAFSFDDSFRLEHWYRYGKDLFGFYDVKVTFNINAFHQFVEQKEHTQTEIDKLLELQSHGHEIAHHGFRHRNAVSYSRETGLSKWVEDDIISMFNWMEKQVHSRTNEKFKKPVTYAMPFSAYNEETIDELVPKYFKIARGHLNQNNLTPFNHQGLAPAICIDQVYLSDIKYIKKLIKMAKQTGRNLIFMCHSILPEEISWDEFGFGEESKIAGEWRVSPKTLQAIIKEAKDNDMEFYTTAELAGVATFIDRNLENCIRKRITNPLDQWISISELSQIKELDLSGQNISNLDGIQYFINLEKLNVSNNRITDFRLIEKLYHLKDINISNNPITEHNVLEQVQ